MSSQKRDKDFFVSGTVTQRGLIAYLNNEMSAEDAERCEKLLKDDPFAREALEGMQAAKTKAAVFASVNSLNKKVRTRAGITEAKPLQIHWTNYAWAAVLLGLLIGVGVVMVNFIGKEKEQIAQNKEVIQESNEQPILNDQMTHTGLPVADTSVYNPTTENQNELAIASDSNAFRQPVTAIPFPNVSDRKTEMKNADKDALTITGTFNSTSATDISVNAPADLTAERTFIPDSFKTTMSKRSDNGRGEATTVYGYTTETNPQKVVRGAIIETDDVEKVTLVTLDDAMKNFNSRNYEQASRQFEAILGEQPGNTEALYYGGISDYINGYDKKSEKKFDRLLKEGTKYTDGSKWYKANLLIKKGKKEEALKLLNELSESNSSYKERAIKKKAEVKF